MNRFINLALISFLIALSIGTTSIAKKTLTEEDKTRNACKGECISYCCNNETKEEDCSPIEYTDCLKHCYNKCDDKTYITCTSTDTKIGGLECDRCIANCGCKGYTGGCCYNCEFSDCKPPFSLCNKQCINPNIYKCCGKYRCIKADYKCCNDTKNWDGCCPLDEKTPVGCKNKERKCKDTCYDPTKKKCCENSILCVKNSGHHCCTTQGKTTKSKTKSTKPSKAKDSKTPVKK